MSQNRSRKKPVLDTPRPTKTYSLNVVDNIAAWINSRFEISNRISSSSMSKILWFMMMAMIYIYFQHNFDGLIRKLDKTERILKDKRAYYIYKKSKYLFASKQSEIERKLIENGTALSPNPPIKLIIQP